MFQVSRPIYHKLGLVLTVLSKFATDAINKSPIISEVLSEELFKLNLYYFGPLKVTFMLVPALYYWFIEG